MKLNLGCGGDHLPGWLNVDKFPEAKPDKVMDLEKLPWPLEDDCADEVLLKHVLEHLGRDTDTFLGIMKELYRVTKPGGKVHIWVPHPRHSDFLADPTHCRPILPDLFLHFSLAVNRDWQARGLPGTPLAMYLGLDFHIESSVLHLDPHWLGQLQGGRIKAEELDYAIRTYNNVVQQVEVVLRPVKPFALDPPKAVRAAWEPFQGGPVPTVLEGTLFRNHSLSKINRELATRLIASGAAELCALPYEADDFDPRTTPQWTPLREATRRSLTAPVRVHIRHQWPPQWNPPSEGAWVLFQHWEYGVIPKGWVEPLKQVDEVWVLSAFTRDCFVSGGVPAEKVVVLPGGVDTERFRPEGGRAVLPTMKGTRFLFVGGTIARKGIDVLLKAYRRAFTSEDDVALVIKGNPLGAVYTGSDIQDQLRAFKADPRAPEVVYLPQDLDEGAMADLYRACQVLVLPSRGEGFGMPVAEAMACGLPAIVTGRGACRDFCDASNALLLPSLRVAIGTLDGLPPAGPHYWLEEPDEEALVQAMRTLAGDAALRERLGKAGRARILQGFTWEHMAQAAAARLRALAARPPLRFAPPAEHRTGFLLKPTGAAETWLPSLQAYLGQYAPGDPVLLVVDLSEGPSEETFQEVLLSVLRALGLEAFPDLVLAATAKEREEWLGTCSEIRPLPSLALPTR